LLNRVLRRMESFLAASRTHVSRAQHDPRFEKKRLSCRWDDALFARQNRRITRGDARYRATGMPAMDEDGFRPASTAHWRVSRINSSWVRKWGQSRWSPVSSAVAYRSAATFTDSCWA